jgi:hypothetical protein
VATSSSKITTKAPIADRSISVISTYLMPSTLFIDSFTILGQLAQAKNPGPVASAIIPI